MSEIVPVGSNQLVDHLLHNPYGEGWRFSSGDPEYWFYADALLRPGGRLLDVGAGIGRSCLYFAMHGMDVLAVEPDAMAVDELSKVNTLLDPLKAGSITPLKADILTAEIGEEKFDTVLLAQTLVHAPSKELALNILDRSWQAVKPGGHIWVRAGGKEDSNYEYLLWQHDEEDKRPDVLEELCSCSGEERYDPILFFGQTDLLQYFSFLGARIVHSQLMPQKGHANMMFGEDFNDGMYIDRSGTMTIIAQKQAK